MALARIHFYLAFCLAFAGLPGRMEAQQSCTPPPSGLVGWWPGDGNANDIVGGDVAYVPGEVGQAFSFDASAAW
jgi:hypothetical protein